MNDHSHQDIIIPTPPPPSSFSISVTFLDETESHDEATAYGTNDGVFHYLLPEGVIRLIPLHVIGDIWIVPKYDHDDQPKP